MHILYLSDFELPKLMRVVTVQFVYKNKYLNYNNTKYRN